MKIVLNILLLLVVTSLQGEENVDVTIARSYWNIETNTLDIILHGSSQAIEALYSHHEDIRITLDKTMESEFEMTGISKGLMNISEKKSTVPNKILIVIDHGLNNSSNELLVNYRQLSAEIISKHPTGFVFDLAVLSNRLSSIQRTTKFSLENTILDLTKSCDSEESTDFNRLFRSIDIQNYKKLYILTNGKSPILDNNIHAYHEIIDRDKLGNTQIVPVSKEDHVNESFFTYLDGLNYMSVDRPSFGFIPEGEMPKPLSPYDNQLLLLKYQQTIESPLSNQPYKVHVEYDGEDSKFTSSFTGVLRPFTSAIINTHVETKASSIKTCLIYGILLSIFLYILIPTFNRISFKRNHVVQYREIKEEGVTHSDPLKMSKIKDEDQVVCYGQHVMLLESWKYIKDNMSNPKYAKEYSHFYVDTVDGDLFSQHRGPFKYVLALWLGSVLATLCSLMYIVLSQNVFANWTSIDVYSTIQTQISGDFPLLNNVIIVFFILLGSQCIFETITWSRTKLVSLKRIYFKSIILPVLSILIVGMLYGLHHFELDVIPYALIITAAISLYITLSYFGSFQQFGPRVIQQYLSVCLLAYVSYQLLSFYVLSSYFNDHIIFQISSFLFFSGIACLYIKYFGEESQALGIKVVSPPEIERDIFSLEQHFQSELSNEFSIGKSPDSDLYIKWIDVNVEMNHAKITKTGDQFEIEPKDGKLFVNSSQIFEKTIITRDDQIKFGEDSISHFTIINL